MDSSSAVILFLLHFLVSLHVATTAKDSSSIHLTGASSIYPCLDSYDLLISGNTIQSQDTDFHRVIRLFYSSSISKRDIRDLTYLKEYKVPFNNLIKLDCQSNTQFKIDAKIHCFQYVTRNSITDAIVESSKLYCFPTNKDDIDEFNNETYKIEQSDVKKLNKLQMDKLRNLQFSPNIQLKSSNSIKNTNEEYDNSLILNCECNVTTFISLNLNHIAHYFVYFTHGEFKIDIIKCDQTNSKYNYSKHKNEITVTTKTFDSIGNDVCILNLTSIRGYKKVKILTAEVNSVVYSNDLINSKLNNNNNNKQKQIENEDKKVSTIFTDEKKNDQNFYLRDGILSISPLITIANSTFQHLHSSFLRIESKDYYKLKLVLSISHIMDDETLDSNLRLLHVVMAAIFAICLFTCCISTVICISAGRETDKVITSDIMENATMLSDTPGTVGQGNNNEYVSLGEVNGQGEERNECVKQGPKGNVSLSQFDLADVDSMEMDYYDYHCSINGGKKTPLLRTTPSVNSTHRPGNASSEPVTEEESAFNN